MNTYTQKIAFSFHINEIGNRLVEIDHRSGLSNPKPVTYKLVDETEDQASEWNWEVLMIVIHDNTRPRHWLAERSNCQVNSTQYRRYTRYRLYEIRIALKQLKNYLRQNRGCTPDVWWKDTLKVLQKIFNFVIPGGKPPEAWFRHMMVLFSKSALI